MGLANDVYKLFRDRILNKVPEIQEVHRDNRQPEHEDESIPYHLPMVLMRLGETEWESYQHGVQLGNSSMLIRIVQEELTDDDSAIEDLAEKVNSYIHGYGVKGFGVKWVSPFIRVRSAPSFDHDRVQIYEIRYEFQMQDTTAYEVKKNEGQTVNDPDLELTRDLVINSDTLRTQ